MVIICNEATLWFARPRKALCLYVRGWQVITNGENGTRAFKEQSGVQDLPSVSQHFSSYAEVYCLPCVSLYREWTFFWDWSNAGSFPDEEETHFSKWNSCIMAETLIKIELLYLKKIKYTYFKLWRNSFERLSVLYQVTWNILNIGNIWVKRKKKKLLWSFSHTFDTSFYHLLLII